MSHSRIRRGDQSQSVVMTVPPTVEPLTLDAVKEHLRITRTDQDPFLTALISRARKHLEELLGQTISATTYELRLDRFPTVGNFHRDRWVGDERREDGITLPFPPVTTVGSIEYQDVNDVTTVLPATDYTVDLFARPAVIVPAFGLDWPETRGHINDLTITYTAGYDGATHVRPESIDHALLMLIAHWHEHREAAIEAPLPRSMAFAFESLTSMNRVREFA